MAEQKRDKTLDVLKGIGIILMVVGHSGSRLANFIYLFHMALFFMASGYVWNDKKVKNFTALKQGVLARVRGHMATACVYPCGCAVAVGGRGCLFGNQA